MVLPWFTVAYGAVLSAVVAALLVALVVRPRQPTLIIAAAAGSVLGPLAWNSILNRVGATEFFVDAPVAVFPVSWQDTGSGVFATAAVALAVGFGPGRHREGRDVALAALLSGIGALLVDIYLY